MESNAGKYFNGLLYQQLPDGSWRYLASLGFPHCDGDLQALRAGQLKLVPSAQYDALLAGRHLPLNWVRAPTTNCPSGH